jgi:hypothetical protein
VKVRCFVAGILLDFAQEQCFRGDILRQREVETNAVSSPGLSCPCAAGRALPLKRVLV